MNQLVLGWCNATRICPSRPHVRMCPGLDITSSPSRSDAQCYRRPDSVMTSSVSVLLVVVTCSALAGVTAQRFYSGGAPAVAALSCTTPQGQQGQCVFLQECDHLFKLYRQSRNSVETRTYLRQFVCNQEDRYSKMCCADNQVDVPPAGRPTPRPTPRPFSRDPPRDNRRPTPAPGTTPSAMKLVEEPTSSEGSLLQHRNVNQLPVDECGQEFSFKIYGGNQTTLGEFPWAALLQYELNGQRNFQCGGVLISKRYVLTAGHCSSKGTIGMSKLVGVRLGEHDINTNPDCEPDEVCRDSGRTCPDVCADPIIDYGIEEEIVHSGYRGTSQNQHNDIALLRLSADAPSTGFIRPICIPLDESLARKSYAGLSLTATGWGRATSGINSPVKLKADLPSVSNDECAALYAKSRRNVTSLQMCAGGVEGVDVCGGDSGGPLMSSEVVNGVRRFHATGIVSYGNRFCHFGTPGVYTRVAAYSRWILDQLRP